MAIVCVVFFLLPFKPKPFGDGDYHIGTIQLIDYAAHGFSGNVMVNKGFMTLFYYLPAYLPAYPFHSDRVYFALGVVYSCLVVCWAVVLLFRAFGVLSFSMRSRRWILVLICLFPVHVYYAMGIIGEAFGFFAAAWLVLLLSKIASGDRRTGTFALLALALVMLYGCKPSMLPFVAAYALCVLAWRFPVRGKLAFLACFMLLPALMALERSLDHSGMEFKRTVFRSQLLWSRFELRDEPFNWMPQHGQGPFASRDYLNNLKKRAELDSLADARHQDRTAVFVGWVAHDIAAHPGLTLRQYVLKFFQSQAFVISPLIKSSKPAWIKYGIHIYINLVNYALVVLGLAGLTRLFAKRRFVLAVPMLLFWGWCLLYICAFHSEQRYMFVFRAALIYLAAAALQRGNVEKGAEA
jgi:hypothetical protein